MSCRGEGSAMTGLGGDGLTEAAATVLARLEAFGRENDLMHQNRTRKMLNLERDTARLLHLLVRSTRRRRVLEVGTSNGVSAIWLASARLDLPGAEPLVTLEREAAKHGQAVANIAASGLARQVRPLLGDATELMASLAGPFDCVFFDADRVGAAWQLGILLPKLEPDCLLLADNALSHPAELASYRTMVEGLPGIRCAVVPTGKGLHVAHRRV